MPPSQLKRLKSSLREQGVVGPQKSKRQKRQATRDGSFREGRLQRNAALQGIREQFNPFEIRAPSRTKYEFAHSKISGGKAINGAVGRPGVTKGLGEEKRRKTLLVEMQRRQKVGGIMDRRFGESDPTMTPEEKALQRFVKEKEKGNRRGAIFNLEDAGDDDQLTHFGKSLSFDRPSRLDDFEEFDTTVSDEDLQLSGEDERPSKRRRLSETPSDGDAISDSSEKKRTEQPRTKKEVMAEIVAKSKLHKYERQQAKEDDDDLRAELDKGLPDIFALLQGVPRVPTPASKPVDASAAINPDRAALLNGKDRSQADKEYDERLRQMAFDQRAKPTERTIKEEERLQLEVQRLNELENKRLRRMRGDPNDSDEEEVMGKENLLGNEDTNEQINDNFGLGSGIMDQNEISKLGFEDEDDFIIENNLIASDIDEPFSENESDNDQNDKPKEENEDDEFVQGLLTINDSGRDGLNLSDAQSERLHPSNTENLAYTYSCPESHQDWLQMTKDIPIHNLATVIQRIRALYHPKLHSDNKSKLGIFSTVLVDHISFLTNKLDHPPFVVLETLIRHIHSLAKTFPEEVARTFRKHLKSFHETRPIAMSPGDLILLTAIGSIFPTSDHFHQVVTPAVLCMTRYISQTVPQSLNDLVKGTYIESLCLQYQQVSKRYIPELVDYSLQTMLTLAPVKLNRKSKPYPYHPPCSSLKIQHNLKVSDDFARKLKFWDIIPSVNPSEISIEELKTTLLTTHLTLINTMADLWADKPAFCEVFSPFLEILQHLLGNPCSSTLPSTTKALTQQTLRSLQTHLENSRLRRRPLALHNHRPLAIKTSIPKFEDSYNPDRHYDPDRERAESSKLKAEHKRERKGALRELRKDASFMAREELREKRERDDAYEKKFKRLVAEIQGEEGREQKGYEREKRMRKGKR